MTSTRVRMIHGLYEDGGKGSPSNPVKFKSQDFEKLRDSLLKEGGTFEDEMFPPTLDSLGTVEGLTAEELKEVEWLSPLDLNPDASFVVDGTSRFDFQQGQVGNCWFLSAIGVLTLHKSLIAQVVPQNQGFRENYTGIFHFRFWRYGKWVDVVIDDLLPTVRKVPLSVSSKSKKEFWAPLLEKAYAKVCGSYSDMIAGNSDEAFKDFTGGVSMNYTLSKSPPDLWDVMNRAVHSKAMMGCGTYGGEKGKEFSKKFDLVEGHAFGVTGVKQMQSQGETVNLVRVWNPWGEKEWNGDWSDKSDLWETVSNKERELYLKERNDGEFWIALEDFCTYFEEMDICCESPNFVDDDAACHWNCLQKEGRWEAGKSAGGPDYSTEEFWTNPQYRLTVKAVEGDYAGDRNVLLSLLQKPDEEFRSKVKYQAIGFNIFELPSEAPKGHLSSSFFQDKSPIKVSTFSQRRELIEFHSLELGEYLIVPCTYEPNKTSSFIITTYSKAEADME
ncbi:calpain-2 catalytic subunit-like [Cheilinus undulatus]|uniref:calpain-2 catalytic subunit-like n=1 Tax=Cheilinus undulatus TaxID=241271 RepID=UPI001BD252E0|nr:calpain-2 catalytic subunit-like [Cheilinus undulatus]